MAIPYFAISIAVLIVCIIVLIILIYFNCQRPHETDPAKFATNQKGYAAGFGIFGFISIISIIVALLTKGK
jgi:hypothetical protein